ncbi:1,4-dihydroxy-2-naphthoate octaprenyltransferase [compost metagenome]
MSKLSLFIKASRFWAVTVMLVPVFLGGIGAYVWKGEFHPALFILTLIGAASAHLFSNMINDLWDYRNGADVAAKENPNLISTNSGLLSGGIMSERIYAAITWSLLGLAVISAVILSIFSGWLVMAYCVLGGLIAYFYVAPPIRYGYRGKGYSEIAILLSFGVLPIMGTYYVQTGEFSYGLVLLAMPVGILTTMLLFNHHFLHWQADEQAGKKSLVVVWGEKKSLRFSKTMLFLAYAFVVICVVTRVLPVYALIALLTAIPLYKVYGGLKEENPSAAYLPLMGASQKASVRCGIVMMAAMLVQGIFQ